MQTKIGKFLFIAAICLSSGLFAEGSQVCEDSVLTPSCGGAPRKITTERMTVPLEVDVR